MAGRKANVPNKSSSLHFCQKDNELIFPRSGALKNRAIIALVTAPIGRGLSDSGFGMKLGSETYEIDLEAPSPAQLVCDFPAQQRP